MQHNSRWHLLETADEVALAVYDEILEAAQEAIKRQGKFKLVLAGGSTPEKVYKLLAKSDTDWARWYIYYGDERCLPVDHAERNSLMATHCFLENVAIPEAHVFTMPAELGPEIGAKEYRELVIYARPFDMVLLGMGEDGHTASLFPGHQHKQDELVHAVYNSPKPPSERMSISAEALSSTHQLIIMVTGANKQDAVNAWRSGQDLPVATINPKNTIDIYIDKDAFKS